MPDWVIAAERAYIAAAVGSTARVEPSAAAADLHSTMQHHAHAIAAAGAVASRHLAVGAPRSFGIVIDHVAEVEAGALSLVAHRIWFAPRDIRCAATGDGAAELATATGGRMVSVDEALACDIVNVHSTRVRILPAQLRRGTHVNAVTAEVFDSELFAVATVVREAGLPALAAGLIDGRKLDELTIFVIDGAPVAALALTSPS
jgi:hypothetical protein